MELFAVLAALVWFLLGFGAITSGFDSDWFLVGLGLLALHFGFPIHFPLSLPQRKERSEKT